MSDRRTPEARAANVRANRTRALALIDELIDEARQLDSLELIERWTRTREVIDSAYQATLRVLTREGAHP